jgi:hypothetical protein
MGAVDVLLAEGGVGLGDADESDLGMRRETMEKALDVAVNEADYGNSDWRLCFDSHGGARTACESEKKCEDGNGCGGRSRVHCR